MKQSNNQAVSPVVGVMLMLVVVVIIAAVVSGFAGGLIGTNNQKAPTINMDVKIVNTGGWAGSGFFATVTAVSKPIDTSDLKIVTSWTAANGGVPISNGSTILPNVQNTYYFLTRSVGPVGDNKIAPYGTGPGVKGSATNTEIKADTNPTNFDYIDQQFGKYKLVPGTVMSAPPIGAATGMVIGGKWNVDSAGNPPKKGGVSGQNIKGNPSGEMGYGVYGRWRYYYGGPVVVESVADPVTAVLGMNWEKLRAGDKVNVKVIYIPNGKVIFNQDIPVTEG